MRRTLLAACLLAACGGGGSADAPDARTNGNDIDAAYPPDDAAAADAYVPTDAPVGVLPDVMPWAPLMDDTWEIGYVPNVQPTDPVYVEGCVGGLGTRKVLRFDTVTANLGEADFYVGPPSASNPLFVYSPAHMHYHVKDYADYKLLGSQLFEVSGHKQAFCLLDSTQITPGAQAHYGCNNQGISVGYADTYGSYLDCQWIDITTVPPGTYTLQVSINPTHLLAESDYSNNVYETEVAIP